MTSKWETLLEVSKGSSRKGKVVLGDVNSTEVRSKGISSNEKDINSPKPGSIS